MNYQFTNTWFADTTQYWPGLFERLQWSPQAKSTIIEIGSYEGQSTVWILENLVKNPDTKIYCIDTFEGGFGHTPERIEGLSDRFIHNVELTGKADQVEVLIGESAIMLANLLTAEISADFIYVDGSHIAKDVLVDAVLSWRLLKPGGLIIFDDYLWQVTADINSNPKMAIDAFVNCNFSEIMFVTGMPMYQLALLKRI